MGLRGLSKFKQTCHHVLDLLFLGAAVADDRRLDRQRRVFGDFQSGGGGGEHGNAPDLPQFQRRLHVERIKNVFDRDFIGLVLGDNLAEMREDAGRRVGSFSRGDSLMAPQVRQQSFPWNASRLHRSRCTLRRNRFPRLAWELQFIAQAGHPSVGGDKSSTTKGAKVHEGSSALKAPHTGCGDLLHHAQA